MACQTVGLLLLSPRLLGAEHQGVKCKGNFSAFKSAQMGFVMSCCPSGAVRPPSMGWTRMVFLGPCGCVGLGGGEAKPNSVPLLGWFVQAWCSILAFPWPAVFLLRGHLSHAGPVPPAPSLCLWLVPPSRWSECPKQGPPLPHSQIPLIRALGTAGVTLCSV